MYYLDFQDTNHGYSYFCLRKQYQNVKLKVVSAYLYKKRKGIYEKLYNKLDKYGYATLMATAIIPLPYHPQRNDTMVFLDALKDELRLPDIDVI